MNWAGTAFQYCDGTTWQNFGGTTFAAGTVGAPGWAVTGDTDTGLYENSANMLSITAGGTEVARFGTATSAVNYFYVTPSGTTSPLTLGAGGSDTDISISIVGKGAGKVLVGASGNATHTLQSWGNFGVAASGYMHFGTVDGSSGYGFRDNAGSIECKNSGGSWVGCASAASTFAAGTISAPGWAVTGDTDTGLYEPAANTLSLTAGGVEAARFATTASGVNYFNFAPGAAGTPGNVTMSAAGSSTNVNITITPKGSGGVISSGSSTTQFTATTSNSDGYAIKGYATATAVGGDNNFAGYFQNDTPGGMAVYGLANDTGSSYINYGGYFMAKGALGISVMAAAGGAATTSLQVQGAPSQTANLVKFTNSGGTALSVVNASGWLGIGTATPGATLHVNGTLAASAAVQSTAFKVVNGAMTATAGNDYPLGGFGTTQSNTLWLNVRAHQNASSTGWSNTAVGLSYDVDSTVGAGGQLWFANGNIGIGTANPTYPLDVVTSANGTLGVRSYNSNAGASAMATFTADNGTKKGYFFVRGTGTAATGILSASDTNLAADNGLGIFSLAGPIKFAANGVNESMRIDTTGNVGIGTASPLAQLSLGNTVNNSNLLSYSSTDQGIINFYQAQNFPATNNYYRSLDIVSASGAGATKSIIRFLNQQASSGAPAEAMRIDQSGNLGIGNAAPGVRLEINGTSAANYTTGTEEEFKIYRVITGGVSYPQAAALALGTYNNSGACCGPSTRLDFKLKSGATNDDTTNVTVMTMTDAGNVGIGTTSPLHALDVWGSAPDGTLNVVYSGATNFYRAIVGTASGGTNGIGVTGINSTTGSYAHLGWASYGVYCNGSSFCGGNVAWSPASDMRLKEHVRPLQPDDGLATIMKLRPIWYHWRDAKLNAAKGDQPGFIAQEVEKILPSLVGTAKGVSTTIKLADSTTETIQEPKSLAYETLVVPLVKAVQQLKADNDNLRHEFEAYRAAHP